MTNIHFRISRTIYLMSFSLLIIIPFLLNILFLNGEADPFFATSVAQATNIIAHGRIVLVDFYNNVAVPYWYWQGHTYSYINEVLIVPGITIAIISLITSLGVEEVLYVPSAYLTLILSMIIIIKSLLVNMKRYELRILVSVSSFILFISTIIIGRFYTLEYHCYAYALSYTIIWLLIKIIVEKRIDHTTGFIFTFIILYLSLVLTHYRFPYLLFGGFIFATILIQIMKIFEKNGNINGYRTSVSRIIVVGAIVSITILFLCDFYVQFVGGRVNLYDLLYNLLTYGQRIARFEVYETLSYLSIPSSIVFFYNFMLKMFTYLGVFYFLLIIIICLLYIRNSSKPKIETYIVLLLSVFIIGASVGDNLGYFYAYRGNLGLTEHWLILPVAIFISSLIRENIPFLAVKKMLKYYVYIFTIVAILYYTLGGYITLITRFSYNPLTPPPPGLQGIATFLNFASGNYVVVGGLSTMAYIYSTLSFNNYYKITNMIFANMPIEKTVDKLYYSITKHYDLVIFTSYELKNGMYADVYLGKALVPPNIIDKVFMKFNSQDSLLYSNGNYYLYCLRC